MINEQKLTIPLCQLYNIWSHSTNVNWNTDYEVYCHKIQG